MLTSRRQFLGGAASAALALPGLQAKLSEAPGSFDFIFATDTHIQPELNAADGCRQCFSAIRKQPKFDFIVHGGDLVFDVLAANKARATNLFRMGKEAEQLLGMPVHHVIGNHDLFGILAASGIEPSDPLYGKHLWEQTVGNPTHYSFGHKGHRIIVLDSIQPTPDRQWEALIDDVQLTWLKGELEGANGAPVLIFVHVPLVTASAAYGPLSGTPPKYQTLRVANASIILPLLEQHNVIGVFQGHTHINETVLWRGIPYITGGAVCGNWWHGTRWGIPEGYTRVSVRNGKVQCQYQTYGFRSVAPQNT